MLCASWRRLADRRCGDNRRNSVDKPQAVAMRVRRRNDGLGGAAAGRLLIAPAEEGSAGHEAAISDESEGGLSV
jgi:hypothetical protein